MEEKRINWLEIIITALITGAIAIITGVILFNIQTKKPKLEYLTTETSPFQGTNQNFAIYNIIISSSGGKEIKNVKGLVNIPNASLSDIKVSAPASLDYSTNINDDEMTIEISTLNPDDTISITIFTTSQSPLPQFPEVSVRGDGITGKKVEVLSSDSVGITTMFAVIALVATFAAIFSSFIYNQSGHLPSINLLGIQFPVSGLISSALLGKHVDDENKILAYICGLYGLLDDVENYLTRQGNTSYWAEADRISSLAIANAKTANAEKRKQVLLDLLEYASLSNTSESIINYDIARISLAQGNVEESKTFLEVAIKKGGRLIKTRLKIDSSFNSCLDEMGIKK